MRSVSVSMMPQMTGTRPSTMRTVLEMTVSRRSLVEKTTSPEEPRMNSPSTPASIMRLMLFSKDGTSTLRSAVSGTTTGGMTPENFLSAMLILS